MSEVKQHMKQKYFSSHYRDGESHCIAYTGWGDPGNPKLLFCSHGLSRNGRDFDDLASAMADHYHVICPDYPGRGLSEKLDKPEDYDNMNFLTDSINLLSLFDSKVVDWVGTSMGGIIGMFLASMENSPIRKLVLNDVGTFIPKQALEEIARYLGPKPHFENKAQARHYFETAYIGFGPMTPEQIDHLTKHGIWRLDSGGYQLSCDHRIIDRFINSTFIDVDLWDDWNRISTPTLVVRGKHSTLLTATEMQKMMESRENITAVAFDHCGHAPSLMHPDHIRVLKDWLLM